jgi:hypothetical protein
VGGSISQVLNLTEGASYQLSLWVGNHWFHTDPNAYKVLDISWGGVSVASEIIPLTSTGPEISWSQLTYTVVATSSLTELRLATPTLNGGPLIDDISVTFVAVPEPSTVALATALLLPALLQFHVVLSHHQASILLSRSQAPLLQRALTA